uniref:SDR family NAD(P)-dependent oxidoreductase n=1 Tax=Gordonia bronchialis TaxID=2054 RepID=UPI0022721F81
MSLNGKIAIVTGAHQGIGQATAIRLAADGAHVIAADLQDCEVTIKEITEAGHSAEAVRLDVRRNDQDLWIWDGVPSRKYDPGSHLIKSALQRWRKGTPRAHGSQH